MTDLPNRVVVGANGAYWRDYGDHYSMCPVSEDNDPIEPVAVYVRADGVGGLLSQTTHDLREAIDAVADALNAWDQGAEPRPDTHRHWSKIVDRLAASPGARHDVPGALDVERLARMTTEYNVPVTISFDYDEAWLVATDPEGVSIIVAKDVDGWYGAQIVARLAPIPEPEPGSAS